MSASKISDPHDHTPTLSYVVGRLDRVVRSAIAAAVAEQNLSVNQYTVLSVLGHRGSLSNAQLARRSYVSPQSMNEVLLALESRGFVRRDDDPNHGRIRQTALTAKGRAALTRCDGYVEEIEQRMTSSLSSRQRADLHNLMIECVRGLRGGFPKK